MIKDFKKYCHGFLVTHRVKKDNIKLFDTGITRKKFCDYMLINTLKLTVALQAIMIDSRTMKDAIAPIQVTIEKVKKQSRILNVVPRLRKNE